MKEYNEVDVGKPTLLIFHHVNIPDSMHKDVNLRKKTQATISSLSLALCPGSKAATTSGHARFAVNVINKSDPLKTRRRVKVFCKFFCMN